MYGFLNNRLLKKPFLNVHNAHILLEMMTSYAVLYNESLWIFKLIANGLKTSSDYYIYKRSCIFEHLMSLYDSILTEKTVKVCYSACILHFYLQRAFAQLESGHRCGWLSFTSSCFWHLLFNPVSSRLPSVQSFHTRCNMSCSHHPSC